MKVLTVPQYSPEWWEARRGLPTCSEFRRIITPSTGKLAAGCESYIHYLIGTKITFNPNFFTERPMSRHMQHGVDTEEEARKFYSMHLDADVQQVGFCISDDGRYGGSPDGLIGTDGGLELKCPKIDTHIRYLIENVLPPEYAPQVHGHLLVTGRPYWDFMSYVGPDVKPFIVRVEPNGYTRNLNVVLEQFLEKYEKMIKQLMGGT